MDGFSVDFAHLRSLFHSHWTHFSLPLGSNQAIVLPFNGNFQMHDNRSEMRDIRPDLHERLAENAARYSDEIAEYNRTHDALEKSHQETLTVLGRERAALEQLLVLENERHNIPRPTLAQKIATLVPLGDFLVTKLQAHGPMEKEQLRAEATLAGYLADGNGRSFHITLINLTKGRRLLHLPDGRYAAPERHAATLFSSEGQTREGTMQ